MDRFWSKVDKTETCWLWTGGHNEPGYGRFWLEGRMVYAHRFVLELCGRKAGKVVLHECDTPACVNPAHLRSGTHRTNSEDCKAKGRNNAGERNGMARLTSDAVLNIRARVRAGETRREVADSLGLPYSTVRGIVNHSKWRHI